MPARTRNAPPGRPHRIREAGGELAPRSWPKSRLRRRAAPQPRGALGPLAPVARHGRRPTSAGTPRSRLRCQSRPELNRGGSSWLCDPPQQLVLPIDGAIVERPRFGGVLASRAIVDLTDPVPPASEGPPGRTITILTVAVTTACRFMSLARRPSPRLPPDRRRGHGGGRSGPPGRSKMFPLGRTARQSPRDDREVVGDSLTSPQMTLIASDVRAGESRPPKVSGAGATPSSQPTASGSPPGPRPRSGRPCRPASASRAGHHARRRATPQRRPRPTQPTA